jgi:solute carrier family 45 protein 1/2/4
MVVGGAATIVALLSLAWVRELVGGFLSIFGVDYGSQGMKIVVNIVATILMYCLDFAIATGVYTLRH